MRFLLLTGYQNQPLLLNAEQIEAIQPLARQIDKEGYRAMVQMARAETEQNGSCYYVKESFEQIAACLNVSTPAEVLAP